MKQNIFITGATSGIGIATTGYMIKHGWRVIACGRRKERLDALSESYGDDIYTLNFDVKDQEAVNSAIDSLPDTWKHVDLLLNNAGNAHGLETIEKGSSEDWNNMLDINVKGLLYVTQKLIPLLRYSSAPHIINIGSIAGWEVYPKGTAYCASKFAVRAISDGLRRELLEHKIRVSEISPGLVNTEFSYVRFKGDTEKANDTYQGMTPLTAEDVAELVGFIATRPRHVNLARCLILPTDQASAEDISRVD